MYKNRLAHSRLLTVTIKHFWKYWIAITQLHITTLRQTYKIDPNTTEQHFWSLLWLGFRRLVQSCVARPWSPATGSYWIGTTLALISLILICNMPSQSRYTVPLQYLFNGIYLYLLQALVSHQNTTLLTSDKAYLLVVADTSTLPYKIAYVRDGRD